jgi:Leucine-rich repeat (LRR) protein
MDSNDGDLDFLKEMTALTHIILDYNRNITGTLPDLSTLSKLAVLSVPNTGLYGELPESLSSLNELKMLYLDDCAFEGSVDVIKSMSNLTHVYLEDNKFTGVIDETFFANSKDLVHLDISNCSFTGSVPGHLFNLTMLEGERNMCYTIHLCIKFLFTPSCLLQYLI